MTTPETPRDTESIFERIFTSVNPETGSKPPAQLAWVVFENGTTFFTEPTEALPADASADTLVAAALGALGEVGPATAGGPAGDFNVSPMSAWFSDDTVHFITFGHRALANVVTGTYDSDLAAGLAGRARRDRDVSEKKITLVRGFDGSKAKGPA